MPLRKCPNGHTYNGDKSGDVCPICGTVAKKYKEEGKTPEEIAEMLKVPENRYVCGWLVCVEGINKGLSYPIHPGKNFIGGGDNMDVQILGDNTVDLYRHAAIAYDETTMKTTLLPGESRGLVYLEGSAVYTPQPLAAYERIMVGGSQFLFVPFCGEDYAWSKQ
ncbi:MAG: FHA domain-containing protein [Oscillospiraceae bacterium]|jgi:hypothetical protein|nr:FHA domain-containing protein [Oscillospiraceae bacterium]